ncbi:MAG: NAD-dependent succinate-semialdehyde dehydrogenase [Reinekea sp.]|nr:NAD-dependent succinate-semialdehyde dehydrogenase [Reinekea sp.]MDX1472680.1 NAD-dependent succinate-semialdehyde dehydrogenase [Reinekea sp.]
MTIHPKLMADTSYVGGQWLTGAKTFAVTNPATGDVLAHVADADVAVAQQAVQAAKDAFPAWRAKTASERSAILRKWFNLMMEYQHELGVIMTLEQGKPLAEAKGEVGYGASFVEWFAEEGKRIYGDTIPAPSNDKRLMVIKQPVGVVASITPWNFPNSMITRKAAPALAAGCTFVIRPSELTPLSALALAKLAEMAGIPEGVFNVVVGTDAKGIGKVFTESPDVAKFSFTGSTAVGKQLIAQSASTVKKVSMELGGNAPFIVFDDADLDAAVTGALASKYRNAGQTCVCANRILVQESVHDAFVEKFVKAVSDMQVGNGMNEGVAIGPLIHEKAMQDIHQRVEDSVAAGAKVALGGHGHALGGSFYTPTVLTEVTNDMPISAIEIFGPVAPVIKFTTEAEAIAIANDTEFGLAAYFYSRDIGRIWRVSEGLDYGMVGINEGIISNAAAPFGGMKSSGLGREGSKYGIDEYIEIKYLCMGGLNA